MATEPPDKADIIKHLEMIQGIINRMAANSFVLRGWSVAAGAALLALAMQHINRDFIGPGLIPVAAFWGLDAYYLRRERLYRGLYDAVRAPLQRPRDEPIAPVVAPFCMDTTPYNEMVHSWPRTLRSHVVAGVHGIVAVVAGLIWLFWR